MERRDTRLKSFKLFGLFNLFDIVVFLLIILVLFYFLKPILVKKQVTYNNYIITMKLLEVPPEMASAVKKGDRIVDKSGRVYGFILEEPKVEPSKKWVETSDGRVVIAEQPVLKDITIKFSYKSTSLKYGTDVFKIGYELVVESDFWALKGVVLSIN
ncbi:MAG: DUF4330 domain-containing protein [Caldisericia bacterium]|jgi:hypothetical protein|nr:DUF4330 domain-containing protein [Caldisericia bacterium]